MGSCLHRNRRWLARHAAAIVLFFLFAIPAPVDADRCGIPIPAQVESAAVIFEGALLEVEDRRMRFRVTAVYKGAPTGEIEVRWTRRSIRATQRGVGSVYLIMARASQQGLVVAPCTGSGLVSEMGEVVQWIERLGFTRAPVDGH